VYKFKATGFLVTPKTYSTAFASSFVRDLMTVSVDCSYKSVTMKLLTCLSIAVIGSTVY